MPGGAGEWPAHAGPGCGGGGGRECVRGAERGGDWVGLGG